MEADERSPLEPGWYWFQGSVRSAEPKQSVQVCAFGVVRVGADRASIFVSSEGAWRVAHLEGVWGQGMPPSDQELPDMASKTDEELVVILARRARANLENLGGTTIVSGGREGLYRRMTYGEEPSDLIE